MTISCIVWFSGTEKLKLTFRKEHFRCAPAMAVVLQSTDSILVPGTVLTAGTEKTKAVTLLQGAQSLAGERHINRPASCRVMGHGRQQRGAEKPGRQDRH